MSDRGNPWVSAVEEPEVREAPPPAPPRPRWASGAEVEVRAGLPVVETTSAQRLWVVAAHGGAGATTWARLLGAGDAGTAWPAVGWRVQVLVVARRNHRGLRAAQQAAMQWAQAGPLAAIDLLGLLLVADAPGRVPKRLREEARLVAGAFPQIIEADWVESWRFEEAWEGPAPREARRVFAKVQQLRREYA